MNEEQMKYVANLISQDLEKDKEINRLNNIINELEEWLKYEWYEMSSDFNLGDVISKLEELKEKNDN